MGITFTAVGADWGCSPATSCQGNFKVLRSSHRLDHSRELIGAKRRLSAYEARGSSSGSTALGCTDKANKPPVDCSGEGRNALSNSNK